jgi:diguanylate cyclase (GGDEF)-like protein/putative nucleotidyltransferase with HDIG domain
MQRNYKLLIYQLSYSFLFVLLFYFLYKPIDLSTWVVVVTFAAAATIFDIRPIVLPSSDNLSLVSPLIFTTGLLYGSSTIFWVNVLTALMLFYLSPQKWVFHIFNCVQFSISGVIGFWVYHLFEHASNSFVVNLSAFIGFSVAYFLCNVFFITMYLWLSHAKPYKELIKIFFDRKAILIYFTMMALGLLMAVVVKGEGLLGFIVFFIILWCLSISYRSYYNMFDHFRSLSEKDELTKLFNHRYFQENLENTLVNYEQAALLMIDLDHFKVYNDTFGHPKGDKLLFEVASIITSNIPPSAVACRYGGEEFTVILPDVDTNKAMSIAETIRQAVSKHSFEGMDHMPQKCITVSIGVSTFPEMASSREQLLMLADQALYKSKYSSRNKVQLYTSVIDELKGSFHFDTDEDEVIQTLKTFLTIINSKDRYTYGHTERIMEYAELLAKRIGLPAEEVKHIRYGALLHDIGKVEVPTEVLNKTTKLDEVEWETIKMHVLWGEQMVESIQELRHCLPMIRHHHERYDGKGYPDQLTDHEIPLSARILTIVDCFDAMTTNRPYQKAKTIPHAIEEIIKCSGTQFDPALVKPFIEVIDYLRPELHLNMTIDRYSNHGLVQQAT